MILNCVIIDDEPLARKGMKEYVQDIEFLHLLGEFENPIKAMDVLTSGKVHLLLLDIQMPKLTGIDLLKSLTHPPQVILTTAYPQYALDGYELNVLDYLLKPISFDRFLKAVMKAKAHFEGVAFAEQADDHFFVKADNKHVRVSYDEVCFVEALQNYVSIHLTNGKLLTYLTLTAMEKQLPTQRFIKVHKSYIVNISKINSIEGNEVIIGNNRIPISRQLRDELMQKVVESKLLRR
jgi:DNA-binding LytR/AlgR family response regulator